LLPHYPISESRIKQVMRGMNRLWNSTGLSACIMILFAGCAWSQEAQSKPQAVDAICLKCHNPIAVSLKKKFKHDALDKGCLTCHMDCREITLTSNRHNVPVHYLKKDEPDVCLECHTPEQKDLSVVHSGQLFKQAKCSSCHEPHGSNSKNRLPDISHGPFSKRDCVACHAPPVNGKVQLVSADIEGLCYGCHTDMKTRIEGAKYRHQVVSKDNSLVRSHSSCLECHDAHATNQKYLLKKPESVLCGACHLRLTSGKRFIHEPVATACTFCHDAHASNLPKTLHAPIHQLCLGCHGVNADWILRSKQPFQLFEERVSIPPNTFKAMKHIGLSSDEKTGHPSEGHPVYSPAKDTKAELNCLSCHTPHADAANPNLLVSDKESLCLRCHTK
jgi:predicted CXXCH cytochrome family protein